MFAAFFAQELYADFYMQTRPQKPKYTETAGKSRYGVGRFIQICPYINVAPKLPNVNIQIDPFATLVPKCQYSDRSIRNIGTQITNCQYSDRSICNIGTQITKCQYSDRSICNIGTQMSIFGSDPFAIRLAGAAIRIIIIIWLEPQSVRTTIIMKIASMT